MDWNKRNNQLTFYNSYLEYLYRAAHKLTDAERQELNEPLELSPFEKAAVSSILNQTILELNVLNQGLGGKYKSLPPSKPPMEVRFAQHILDKLYDEQTLQPLRDCFKAISKCKRETDIEVIRCALEICMDEIQGNQFSKFTEYIFCENREANDEYNLIKVFGENVTELENLRSELKENRQNDERMIAELDDELFLLKTECDDYRKKHQLEIEVVKVWEEARQEQVEAVYSHEVMSLTKARDECEDRTERELIAINEIMTFYHKKCENLEDSLKSWQVKMNVKEIDSNDSFVSTYICFESHFIIS